MIPLPHRETMEDMMLLDKIDALVRESKSERVNIEINGKMYYVLKDEWLKNK